MQSQLKLSRSRRQLMSPNANALAGAFSGYGHGGHGCCKKDDDKTYELLAIGISLFALFQALMMRRRRRKRSAEQAPARTVSVIKGRARKRGRTGGRRWPN